MRIYILRHGQAEPQQTSDEARKLTARGQADTRAVLDRRSGQMQGVAKIFASSLVRAQQTAAIAAEYFPGLALETTDLLIPEADPAKLYQWLQQLPDNLDGLLLVSHQPLVGRVVNQLCAQGEGYYPMGTSSLAALETEIAAPAMAELLWLEHAH